MPSISATPKLRTIVRSGVFCATNSMTDRPTANIMMVAAVLEIHIDKKAVAAMKPAMMPPAPVPTTSTMFNAMRRCRPQRCIAAARRKPPRKRKISGWP